MPIVKNKTRFPSRREFLLKGSKTSMGLLIAGSSAWSSTFFFQGKPNSKFHGVQIGVITYSFRSMPGNAEQVLTYVTESGISAIELMGDVVEEYAGKPVNPVKMQPWVAGQPPKYTDEEKAQMADYEKKMAEWRATVPMEKFVELKKMFNKAGVSIYDYKPNALGQKNTDAEIEYALKAAKALGATSVTVELPKDPSHSKRLGVLLALIAAKHARITTMHIKDRRTKENGGNNMSWGQGDTPVKEILNLLKEKKYVIPATIELEYDIPSGSDAVKETYKCLNFAKNALGA